MIPCFWTNLCRNIWKTHNRLTQFAVSLCLLGTPDDVPGHKEQTESLRPSVTWDRRGWTLYVACPCWLWSNAFRKKERLEWGTSQTYSNLTTDRIQRHQIWVWFRSMVNLWTHKFGHWLYSTFLNHPIWGVHTLPPQPAQALECQRPSRASSDGDAWKRRSRVCEAGLQTRSCCRGMNEDGKKLSTLHWNLSF